jgi:predicted nuclease of predicted toxin-antitoxin system
MARILLNENVPRPAFRRLVESGVDVVSVSMERAGSSDVEVLEWACRQQRWLVTFDRDYGYLVFAAGHRAPPEVILLRVQSYRSEEPAQWVLQMMTRPDEYVGHFSVFDGTTLRRRAFFR